MATVDWQSMTPREVWEVLRTAPKVAGPWKHEVYSNGVESWERRLRTPEDGLRIPIVQIINRGRWWTGSGGGDGGLLHGDTADEAKDKADQALRSKGWLLIGPQDVWWGVFSLGDDNWWPSSFPSREEAEEHLERCGGVGRNAEVRVRPEITG